MENKGRYDKMSFSGQMKKWYLIYADESHRKGKYFSNFYGAALVSYTELEKISNKLNAKKEELGLFQEVKWAKVTEQYLDEYLELIDFFFEFVKFNKIKIRIMNTFMFSVWICWIFWLSRHIWRHIYLLNLYDYDSTWKPCQ